MKLHFEVSGNGEPLVILHGLLGSLTNWQTVGKGLSSRFGVYRLDLRNHGQSPHSDIHTYGAMAGDLVEFFHDHRIETAHLLGHSMGGKVAMTFALSHPTKAKSLIVIDISPKAYHSHHIDLLEALSSLRLQDITSRKMAEAQLATLIPDARTRRFLLTNLKQETTGRFRWRLNIKTLKDSYTEVTKGLHTDKIFPGTTLFVRGGKSNSIESADLPLIKRVFPAAKIVTVPSAGHWVHIDSPNELLQTIVGFLDAQRLVHP